MSGMVLPRFSKTYSMGTTTLPCLGMAILSVIPSVYLIKLDRETERLDSELLL